MNQLDLTCARQKKFNPEAIEISPSTPRARRFYSRTSLSKYIVLLVLNHGEINDLETQQEKKINS